MHLAKPSLTSRMQLKFIFSWSTDDLNSIFLLRDWLPYQGKITQFQNVGYKTMTTCLLSIFCFYAKRKIEKNSISIETMKNKILR